MSTKQDASRTPGTTAEFARTQPCEQLLEMSGMLAHDYNNWLTALLGFAECAFEGATDKDLVRSDLCELLSIARAAIARNNELLALSRVGRSARGSYDLSAVVHAELQRLRGLLGSETVVSETLDPRLPVVSLDPKELGELLRNVFLCVVPEHTATLLRVSTRLVHYEAGAPVVRLSLFESTGRLGPMLLQKHPEKLFRVHASGTVGLALAYVLAWAERYEATLMVQLGPGAGSTLHFTFPQSREQLVSVDSKAGRFSALVGL